MSDLILSHYKEFWVEKSIRASLETLADWRRRARERADLAQLGEREARDLGLAVSQVQFEANKPFWQA